MKEKTLCINGETYLTREGVMDMFNVSGVTLWKWAKKGIIRQHRMGKAALYLEKEISEDIKNSGPAVRKSHKEKVANDDN